jgi:hypothetical protein
MMDGECLVIAGPHGDERNAQRLIMAAQRHFINTGVDDDNLLLYFIPTLSPTMTTVRRGKSLKNTPGNGRIIYIVQIKNMGYFH